MPMLYGEGGKAFYRLQEEIIKQSDDHAIFAWPVQGSDETGLLAMSPDAFRGCTGVRTMVSRKGRSPFTMTNRGLSTRLLATPFRTDTYLVLLECADTNLPHGNSDPLEKFRMGMLLRRLQEDDQFARVREGGQTFIQQHIDRWDDSVTPSKELQINVRQTYIGFPSNYFDLVNGFHIATAQISNHPRWGADLLTIFAPLWNPKNQIMSIPPGGRPGVVGFLDLTHLSTRVKLIELGFDFDYNPVCFVATADRLSSVPRPQKDRLGVPDPPKTFSEDVAKQLKRATEFGRRAQYADTVACDPFDTLTWTAVSRGRIISPFGQHGGFWAVKGDRHDGIDTRLGGVGRLRITRAYTVWEVHLDDLKRSSMGALRNVSTHTLLPAE